MENEVEKEKDIISKIKEFVETKKIYIVSILALLILILIGNFSLDIYQKNENNKIAEKYVKAGIYLTSKENNKSKEILKEIVLKKNKFYSLLALNSIIENDLESNEEEILKLFSVVEKIKIDKEQMNLVKLKKALYLIKLSKTQEANNLLQEIISSDSIWKDTAKQLLK